MFKAVIILSIILGFLNAQVQLTDDEKLWIKNNPIVVVGGKMDWAPFDFVNKGGKYDGIRKDYLDLISQKTGLKFDIVEGYTWNQLLENFKQKKFDILPAVYYSKVREKFGNYTTPYYTVRDYLFVKKSSNIQSLKDLYGKILAIPKGYTIIDKIKNEHPKIKILETGSIADSIALVLSDQADATLEVHGVMTYIIKTNGLKGLKVVSQENLGINPLHMLVQKDKEPLLSILNKAIVDIDKEEQKVIAEKSLSSLSSKELPDFKYIMSILGVLFSIILLLLYRQRIQKQANKKIEEQRKELETMFQTIKEGIAILDKNTKYLYFNDAYLAMTGFTKEELLNKSCAALGTSESLEKSQGVIKKVFQNGSVENFEKNCIVKGGKHIIVNMSISLMPDKERLIISVRDVTQLKEKEMLINEYMKMIDKNVIISLTDLDGKITKVSEAFSQMSGYPKEYLIGKSHRVIRHKDMPDSIFKSMWQAITANQIWQGELKNKRKDGSAFWVKIIISPMFDEFGEKIGYSAIRQDITDKKLVEKKTEEQKSLLSLFDQGDSVLFKWKNDKNWSIDYVSLNVENLLGYTKDEFLNGGVLYVDCIHKDDLDRVYSEVQQAQASSKNFFKHEPYRIVTKKGRDKWVLDYTFIEREDEKITHFLGYIVDITEQENALKNLEKFIDTQDNIVILTDGKEITFANKKFFEFLGFEDIENFKMEHSCICEFFIENSRFFHLGKIKEGENWLEVMQTLPHSKRIVSIMGSDFKVYALSVTINRFDEHLLIVSLTDISQTMHEHIKLEEKTVHDKLTGAYNREYFEQNYKRLTKEFLDSGYRFGLALLDIDHFKLVNDKYGHDTGDEVLIHFVNTLEKYSRREDYLIRWGGEEFIMILKVRTLEDFHKALEHLRKVIEIQEFPKVGQKTCSIGGTLYEEGEDIIQTIKRADEAVYKAKESGRNKVVLD